MYLFDSTTLIFNITRRVCWVVLWTDVDASKNDMIGCRNNNTHGIVRTLITSGYIDRLPVENLGV